MQVFIRHLANLHLKVSTVLLGRMGVKVDPIPNYVELKVFTVFLAHVVILPSLKGIANGFLKSFDGTGFAFEIVVSALFTRVYGDGGLRPPPRPKSFVFKGLGRLQTGIRSSRRRSFLPIARDSR